MQKKGLLFVISGPAGTGKSTVIKKIMESGDFEYSVSATTRAPRPGETEGVNYFFVDKQAFEKKIADDEMLEYATYVGNYYGTPKKAVIDCLDRGRNIILEIEVQGAAQIKKKMPGAIMVMIIPPDVKTLERRLRERGTETDAVIRERMTTAKKEISQLDMYDYVVINRDNKSGDAAGAIEAILTAERAKVSRNPEIKDEFYDQN